MFFKYIFLGVDPSNGNIVNSVFTNTYTYCIILTLLIGRFIIYLFNYLRKGVSL